jgi:hypothetical protein
MTLLATGATGATGVIGTHVVRDLGRDVVRAAH